MEMKHYIEKCLAGEELTSEEASSALELIMTNQASDAQIAGLLIALRAKGETVGEIVGFARTMREKSIRITVDDPDAVDIVGTGGDGSGTFNISTVATFVCSAAGVTVAKHGNRSVSSRSGSADVLSALGANIELPPAKVEQCVNTIGVGFLFAPLFHPAMKYAARTRAELGVRTIFNMLGPITNPAGVRRHMIGAFHRRAASQLAGALKELDADKACVVHSDDGTDEITLSAATAIFEVERNKEVNAYSVSPEVFGMKTQPASGMLGGSREENATIAWNILNNEPSPARDVVIANAAFGVYVGGKAASIREATDMATRAVDSGRALRKLNQFLDFTNRP